MRFFVVNCMCLGNTKIPCGLLRDHTGFLAIFTYGIEMKSPGRFLSTKHKIPHATQQQNDKFMKVSLTSFFLLHTVTFTCKLVKYV